MNSTIAANNARTRGAGIYTRYPILVFNSTIAQNTVALGNAGSGAGLRIAHNIKSDMVSSIVARNTANAGLVESDVSLMSGAYLSGSFAAWRLSDQRPGA